MGIAGAKRKLESEAQTLNGDLDEMSSEAGLSDEKAKKSMVDAASLAEELRAEQDMALSFEKDRKLLECQVKDVQQRLEKAEFESSTLSLMPKTDVSLTLKRILENLSATSK